MTTTKNKYPTHRNPNASRRITRPMSAMNDPVTLISLAASYWDPRNPNKRLRRMGIMINKIRNLTIVFIAIIPLGF
jgi:hypothetical protein